MNNFRQNVRLLSDFGMPLSKNNELCRYRLAINGGGSFMTNISNTEETKKKICEAFLHLYSENDIEKITIKMISDKAQISRSTFYTHYSDVYDLLAQIEERVFRALEKHLTPGVPLIFQGGSLMDIMPGPAFFAEYRLEFKVLVAIYGKSKLPERLKDVIRTVAKEIFLKQTTDLPPIALYVIEYMMNAQLGTFTYWFNNDFEIDYDELRMLMNKAMNEGPLTVIRSAIFNG